MRQFLDGLSLFPAVKIRYNGAMKLRFLYAGDSPAGGPANYLLAVMRSMKAEVVHIPPDRNLDLGVLEHPFDAVILSDFASSNCPLFCQSARHFCLCSSWSTTTTDSSQVFAKKIFKVTRHRTYPGPWRGHFFPHTFDVSRSHLCAFPPKFKHY